MRNFFYTVICCLLLLGCRSVERNLTVNAADGSTVTITGAAGDARQEAPKDYGRAFSGNDAAVSLPGTP